VIPSLLWLLLVGGWAAGCCLGYRAGGDLCREISLVTGVPSPSGMEWWEPLLFFSLTPLSCYLLSQLFFGAASPFLLFLRGTHDGGVLMRELEENLSIISFPGLPHRPLLLSLLILLILSVNLPACLLASHLGAQRGILLRRRLLGRVVRAGEGSRHLSHLFLLLGLSLVAGLAASLLLQHV